MKKQWSKRWMCKEKSADDIDNLVNQHSIDTQWTWSEHTVHVPLLPPCLKFVTNYQNQKPSRQIRGLPVVLKIIAYTDLRAQSVQISEKADFKNFERKHFLGKLIELLCDNCSSTFGLKSCISCLPTSFSFIHSPEFTSLAQRFEARWWLLRF